jgi:hypothetical protein
MVEKLQQIVIFFYLICVYCVWNIFKVTSSSDSEVRLMCHRKLLDSVLNMWWEPKSP